MAEMAEWRGDSEAADHWRRLAKKLRDAIEQLFWIEDMKYYALALDGRQQPCRVRSSNPGHLLYTGAVRKQRAAVVTRQLVSGALSSGWGVRTLAVEAARFNPMSYHNGSVWPHDTALCAAGIARQGDRGDCVRLLRAVFETATHFEMRLPELFCGFARAQGATPVSYPVACLPQAWAAGSGFMLLQACLGVDIDGWRNEIHVDRPQLPVGVDQVALRGIEVGAHRVDVVFQRVGDHVVAFTEGVHAEAVPLRIRSD
jgi:glycogen debranching enzyme